MKIIERLGEDWDFYYGLFVSWQRFTKKKCPRIDEIHKNKALGRWVDRQRSRFKRGYLRPERIKKLNDINMVWDVTENMYQIGLDELKGFKKKYGNCNVPDRFKSKSGFSLGSWLRTRRREYKQGILDKARIKDLSQIGISWNPFFDRWKNLYNILKKALLKKSLSEIERRRNRLGVWVAMQKARYFQATYKKHGRSPLYPEQIAQLEKLDGWTWNRRTDSWSKNLKTVLEFIHKYGFPSYNDNKIKYKGVRVVAWLVKQKARLKKTNTHRRKILQKEIPDLFKDPFENKWQNGYRLLLQYRKKHNTCNIPQKAKIRGFKLGRWISSQRTKYHQKSLDKKRILLLEKVPGWLWDASSFSASNLFKKVIVKT